LYQGAVLDLCHDPVIIKFPANREDIGINTMFRIYAPDVEKMKTWKTPQFEMLPAAS
jgi:hypothetical protein